MRGACTGAGVEVSRVWLAGMGSDLLHPIHRASSAALCSPVQDAEHSDCILESPELLLNK